MSETTVLVLDGHSRAALETLQSLGRAGLQVDLAAEAKDCLAMQSRYVTHKLQQPAQERIADFHSWLRAQDKIRNYALIVPATETSLLGLRQLNKNDPLRRKAIIPGIKRLISRWTKKRHGNWHVNLACRRPLEFYFLRCQKSVRCNSSPLFLSRRTAK